MSELRTERQQLLELDRVRQESNGITFHAALPDDLPHVMADEEKIDRVISNR